MNKSNLTLLIVVILLMFGIWYGLDKWLGKESNTTVVKDAAHPKMVVDDDGLGDGMKLNAKGELVPTLPHPEVPVVVDPLKQATVGGYILEFLVVLVVCASYAAGGWTTVYQPGTVREYSPQGQYLSFSQFMFPTTQYITPPSPAAWLMITAFMVTVLYLVKWAIFAYFAYDTARIFSFH